MNEFVETIRNVFSQNDLKRDRNLKTPEEIKRFDDITYSNESEFQVLDVYSLKNKQDEYQPDIINVHGGGWIYGIKETYQYYCMDLAKRGFKVINFSYRLIPEFDFPSAIEDINLVFKWIEDNQDYYKFDLNNLFAIGDSAGANLLGIYTGIITNPESGKRIGIIPSTNLNLKAVAFNHGCYDLTKSIKTENDMGDINDEIMKVIFKHEPTKEELESISVPTYISNNFPPVYIVSSTEDFLINEPASLINYLTENRIQFIYHFFSIPGIELPHVFHLDIRNKYAKIVNDEECDFFKTFID